MKIEPNIDYKRDYFSIEIGTCDVCEAKKVTVLNCDNSASEYSTVQICEDCINKSFKAYMDKFKEEK